MTIGCNYITERDIDLLIMTAFYTDNNFADYFISNATKDNHHFERVLDISVSKYDKTGTGNGESDIVITYEYNNQIYCLFIENKINAAFQPNQAGRYFERANNTDCIDFTICLLAPKKYLEIYEQSNSDEFDTTLSYESCKNYFQMNKSAFGEIACTELDLAITKAYTTYFNNEVHNFFSKYYEHAKEIFNLDISTDENANGYWVYFNTRYGRNIIHKINKNCIDWTIGPRSMISEDDLSDICSELSESGILDVEVKQTGKSYSLSYSTKSINYSIPFEEQIEEIDRCLLIVQHMVHLSQIFDKIVKIKEALHE